MPASLFARVAWKADALRRSRPARKLDLAAARGSARIRRADVAAFHDFVPPPTGGAHQFMRALVGELQRRGLRVEVNRISHTTRACLFNSFNFDRERLAALRRSDCRMVHRVDGPIGLYRGVDDGTDEIIAAANHALADVTVFQSNYSRDAHRSLGLELASPVVIPNAVDPAIFYAAAGAGRPANAPLRMIASAWSDNPNKGASIYAWMDRNLDWSRYEMTFVGRTGVSFENIRVQAPVSSHEVAALLRDHDVYMTASRNEPCSNALLEGLASGLPALYIKSGSHHELVGEAGLGFDEEAEIPALLERLQGELDDRRAAISIPTLSQVADRYLEALGIAA